MKTRNKNRSNRESLTQSNELKKTLNNLLTKLNKERKKKILMP